VDSGRTPMPTSTMSAGSRTPVESTTVTGPVPCVGASMAFAEAPRCTATPLASSSNCTALAISASSGARTCGANSTTATSRPACRNASAVSSPMKPAPSTTA
jgi:hypothetical protein